MTDTTRRDFLKQASIAAGSGLVGARTLRGQATKERRPNILLLFPDQHRWDWTPAHQVVPVQMPNFMRLAARGVSFERAHVASPVCAPSRTCLASGREYDHCGLKSNDENYPIGQPTFYQSLRESGYRTLGCGKIDLATGEMTAKRGIGLDGKRFAHEWGFSDAINNGGKQAGSQIYLAEPVGPKDSYYVYLDSLTPPQGLICAEDFQKRGKPVKENQWGDTSPSPLDEEHYLDNWIARNGLSLLDSTTKDEPWFLVVNFAGPHPPLDIPKRLEARYRGPDRVIDDFGQPNGYVGPWDAAHHTRIRQNYAAVIENIDHWVGVYIDHLERRGDLDNTIIAFASDHGETLGDHDHWGKSVPWEASVGVPMVVAGPGIERGRRSDALVSLIDLTATFLDYGKAAALERMDGFSMRPLLEGKTRSHREHMLSGLGDWRMVFDGRYKLITGFRGVETRLFDLHEDPNEVVDLAAKDPARVAKLRDLMKQGSYRPT
jgi:arylsulfatase A-like enzyme